MNKNGVALAADSKATVGAVGQQKTFDTVNKLFTLSKVHPVGIMVFGNAEFMSYPWETVVKLYREDRRAKSFPLVAEWAKDFFRYLEHFGSIRPEHKRQNVQQIVLSVIDDLIEQTIRQVKKRRPAVPSAQFVERLIKKAEQRCATYDSLEYFFNASGRKALLRGYGIDIANAIKDRLSFFESDALSRVASELVLLSLFKKRFSPRHSGIVIAGFGSDEYFPTVVHYDTDGYVGRSLKIVKRRETDVSRDLPASVMAFAQADMVQLFMLGAASSFANASLHWVCSFPHKLARRWRPWQTAMKMR